jgi:hypothetical protein
VESDNRQAVDQSLQELGVVPPEIEQLIERYAGSVQLGALQADALLNALHIPQLAAAPASEPPRRPSDAAPEFTDDGDTDGPPMQRMDARLARQSSVPSPPLPAASSRQNTPFPAGLPGADEMPDIARRVPPRGPSPVLVTPPPAAEPEPEIAAAEAQRLEVPEQSSEIPKLPHDDFEVVVDDDIVELDAEDMELDAGDH